MKNNIWKRPPAMWGMSNFDRDGRVGRLERRKGGREELATSAMMTSWARWVSS